MSQCPKYSGKGAGAGHATCQFFASIPPREKFIIGVILGVVIFFCVRYLRTGKIFR